MFTVDVVKLSNYPDDVTMTSPELSKKSLRYQFRVWRFKDTHVYEVGSCNMGNVGFYVFKAFGN